MVQEVVVIRIHVTSVDIRIVLVLLYDAIDVNINGVILGDGWWSLFVLVFL